MRNWIAILVLILLFSLPGLIANAQCSICTKTAQQLGEGPAQGLNAGIIYLAVMPFLIFGYIGYRWLKSNRS